MNRPTVEPLLTIQEVADFLGVPVDTVYRWRSRREGPVGYRVGRHVRYRPSAVEEWLIERADPRDFPTELRRS